MPSVALSTIVRDVENTLPACLDSVAEAVQEITIVDTGSIDSTISVAESYGAKVIAIPWENDFARARNLALAAVTADWVLSLDADELLDPRAAQTFAAHITGPAPSGYLVSIRNYVLGLNERIWDRPAKRNDSEFAPARKYPAYTEHENVRLFRRRPEIHFVGRVHESVGPSIIATGGKLERASFVIHHFGMVAEPEVRARKHILYRELGRQKIHDSPNSAQAHFELGLIEFDDLANNAEALMLFERAYELNPRLSPAWLFAAKAQVRLGHYRESLRLLERAQRTGANPAMVAEAQGDAYYNLGDFEAARRCYRRALERSAGSVSMESKLGLAEIRLGRTASGLARLERAVESDPSNGELYDRLITARLWLDQVNGAAQAAERKLDHVSSQPEHFLRAASIRARMGAWERAHELVRAGLEAFPDAAKLQQALEEVEARLGSTKVL